MCQPISYQDVKPGHWWYRMPTDNSDTFRVALVGLWDKDNKNSKLVAYANGISDPFRLEDLIWLGPVEPSINDADGWRKRLSEAGYWLDPVVQLAADTTILKNKMEGLLKRLETISSKQTPE